MIPITVPAPPPPAAAPVSAAVAAVLLPGFHRSPYFGEQTREEWIEPGIRLLWNAPGNLDPNRPTRLIVFATPNGNTAEQTFGSGLLTSGGPDEATDWHLDIQHVGAQVRRLRELFPDENIVLVIAEAEGLSWPSWRRAHADSAARVRALVESLRAETPGSGVRVALTAHSGGGSFLFGFLNGGDTIPDWVERIAFLDANYSYADEDHHGDKLLAWLKGDKTRHLIVIAYDDREITFDGKKVVGADGGTWRASERMQTRFQKGISITETRTGDIRRLVGENDQIEFHLHTNPKNVILHTALVGEMNGLLQALTEETPLSTAWGTFAGPRAYTKWVQPPAHIPPRPADAPGGVAFMNSIAALPPPLREEAIARELLSGNLPNFLRAFVTVTVKDTGGEGGKERTAAFAAMPDYLAVGSDTDWVRVPMTPMTAQRIADAFGCSLPTRKMVDAVYQAATVRLEPQPLTEAREAVTTFVQHNALVEAQRMAHTPSTGLIAGIQKDVVVTNRLGEKPNRVAIYGWHKLDGSPIQPLTIVHRETYVDYSHGIRLIRRRVTIDNRVRDLHFALHDAATASLFSDEGPITHPSY